MRNTKCSDCEQVFAINETFRVAESILCRACAEKLIQSQTDITKDQIQRQVDATVCVNCGKDNGDTELAKLAGLPACEQCITFFRNRPYPAWLKAAMAGLAAIVVFSFIWNLRFIQAYIKLRKSNAAIRAGDIETTAKLLRSAATKVPETKGLSAIASFCEATLLLKEDKPAEALKLLNSCKADLPPKWPVDEMIAYAEIGFAFDNKDYDRFLSLARQTSEKHPDNPTILAQVASAYACKYAVTNDEQLKLQSLDFLQKARTLSEQQGSLDKFEEYEDRILHRIETREIISRDEFNKRFPDGWKRKLKEQSK
jgi:hypothetical protein